MPSLELLGVVRMTNGVAHLRVEFAAVQDDFAVVNGGHGAERDREVPSVLDIDMKLGSTAWRNLADRADLIIAVAEEDLKPDFDVGQFHAQVDTIGSALRHAHANADCIAGTPCACLGAGGTKGP